MINAVIFDLNGVFLQGKKLTERIEEEFHIPIEESLVVLKESLNNARLNPNIHIFDYWKPLFEKYNMSITEEEFLNFWFGGEYLVPELVELSKELRENDIKVYIFSNNFKERTEYYRKNFKEIFDNVDGSFFSWETGFVKSDIKAYENFLSITKLNPSEIIYFDDSQENVDLAKSLGIKGYIYEDANKTKAVLEENSPD